MTGFRMAHMALSFATLHLSTELYYTSSLDTDFFPQQEGHRHVLKQSQVINTLAQLVLGLKPTGLSNGCNAVADTPMYIRPTGATNLMPDSCRAPPCVGCSPQVFNTVAQLVLSLKPTLCLTGRGAKSPFSATVVPTALGQGV
jgi:hypothetical protein